MTFRWFLVGTIVGILGCAPVHSLSSRDSTSPKGPEAASVANAERELAEAEREANAHPSSAQAQDRLYLARRMVERAHVLARYEADKEALSKAHRAVSRLQDALARRQQAMWTIARLKSKRDALLAARRQAHRDQLRSVARDGGQVLELDDGLVYRLPVERVFFGEAPFLRPSVDPILKHLAQALRSGPPCELRVAVQIPPEGRDCIWISRRRVRYLELRLRAFGISKDWFHKADRVWPSGTQVDFIVSEEPILLSSLEGSEPQP